MLNKIIKLINKYNYSTLLQIDSYNFISPSFLNYLKNNTKNNLWVAIATKNYKKVKQLVPNVSVFEINPNLFHNVNIKYDIILTYDVFSHKDFIANIQNYINLGKSIILNIDYESYKLIKNLPYFETYTKVYILKSKYLKYPLWIQNILSHFRRFSDTKLIFMGVFKP